MTRADEVWSSLVRERPRTILLLDDEVDICESLRMLLEDALPGVKVVTSSTGEAALDILRREQVDLIITDFRMPGMDGLEFLRRARDIAPLVPRIMITAYPELEVALRAINEAGVAKFVPKPLKPEITEYVRVALMDQRERDLWQRSFAMKL